MTNENNSVSAKKETITANKKPQGEKKKIIGAAVRP